MKKPSLQFYPGDWRKDPTICCLSLAARGLWFEMLLLMHEAPERGYLSMSPQHIARAVGSTVKEVTVLLAELSRCGTLSMDGERMFNRRMVRDERVSKSRSKSGVDGAAKRWQKVWQNPWQNDGKVLNLPLPIEVEVEGEVEEEVTEILKTLTDLYNSAGVPIAPKHEQLCCQLIIGIPEGNRARLPRYVKHMLDSGRWSSPAKTKGLLNLLRDGDWDVPSIERTIPKAVNGRNLAEEIANL